MLIHQIRLSYMADVAEMRNMHAIARRCRAILAEMSERGVREIRITGLGALQGAILENLSRAAWQLEEEVGAATAENERNSEAYRLGLL